MSISAYLSEVEDGPWRHPGNDSANPGNDDNDGGDDVDDLEAEQGPGLQQEEVGAAGGPGNPRKGDKPENKSELQKLRERFQNTVKLTSHLYHDLSLRDEVRMVSIACNPYMVEYSETLRLQKLSQAPWAKNDGLFPRNTKGSPFHFQLSAVLFRVHKVLFKVHRGPNLSSSNFVDTYFLMIAG